MLIEKALQGPLSQSRRRDEILDLREIPFVLDAIHDPAHDGERLVQLGQTLEEKTIQERDPFWFGRGIQKLFFQLGAHFAKNLGHRQRAVGENGNGPAEERVEAAGLEKRPEYVALPLEDKLKDLPP